MVAESLDAVQTGAGIAPTDLSGGRDLTVRGPSPEAAAVGAAETGAGLVIRYHNPQLRFDSAAAQVVLMYRDTATGEVIEQYPSERRLQAYREQLAREAAEERSRLLEPWTAAETAVAEVDPATSDRRGTAPAAPVETRGSARNGATATLEATARGAAGPTAHVPGGQARIVSLRVGDLV